MISTIDIVRQQISAMHSGLFEVGLFRPSASDRPNSTPEMILRTWDAETMLKSIPWLKFQNKIGRNIYVRPAGEHQMSLVDDLSAGSIERMKTSGFQPAAVVETSPGNFQAWLNHGLPLSKGLGTVVARSLAQDFGGDLKAADWRHFGRLAAFSNQKEKHRLPSGLFPYVRLVEASGNVYPKAATFISAIQERFEAEEKQRHDRLAMSVSIPHARTPFKSIEQFRANPLYGGDGTRSDLAFALYAVSRGLSEAEIKAALRSRDLSHKGNERRQETYVDRTLRKALQLRCVAR